MAVEMFKCGNSSPTQRLQFLHRLLPHGLDVDARKAPLRGHFDEVRLLVAIRKDFAVKLCMVKQVFAVSKVPGPEERTDCQRLLFFDTQRALRYIHTCTHTHILINSDSIIVSLVLVSFSLGLFSGKTVFG